VELDDIVLKYNATSTYAVKLIMDALLIHLDKTGGLGIGKDIEKVSPTPLSFYLIQYNNSLIKKQKILKQFSFFFLDSYFNVILFLLPIIKSQNWKSKLFSLLYRIFVHIQQLYSHII